MKAIRQYEFGGPDTLRYEDGPDPVPGPDQVLVQVAACGVHLVDTTLRAGRPGGPPLPALPVTPGREVAGTVSALGPGVDPGWLGRRMVAHLGPANGGYAELAVAPVASLHALAPSMSYEAVALIGTGRTALAVLELAALGPSDVVLVPSAAGGLGHLLVQAARRAGAYTIGLASAAKLDLVDADLVVDYTDPSWPAAVPTDRPATVLLDGVGGPVGRTLFEMVGVGGHVVMFGWSSGTPTTFDVWDLYKQGLTVSCAIGPRIQRRGLRAWEEESLAAPWTPLIGPPFALSDAAAAHRAMESRRTYGKTVLVP